MSSRMQQILCWRHMYQNQCHSWIEGTLIQICNLENYFNLPTILYCVCLHLVPDLLLSISVYLVATTFFKPLLQNSKTEIGREYGPF